MRRPPVGPARVVGLLVAVFLVAPSASSAPKSKKKKVDPPSPPVVHEAPEPQPAAPTFGSLFTSPLPIDIGEVPAGLAGMSAQQCNACHYEAHQGWHTSGHATGWARDEIRAAVASAGTPACQACHLPLVQQSPDLVSYDNDNPFKPITTPNGAYDPTLHSEGVTCVTCHVRDGAVIAARPVEGAPHPVLWTPELAQSESCAACHQLSWPDGDKPFYDTYGEWSRSPYAKAGVECQSCHMVSRAGGNRIDHGTEADPARAVSVIVNVDSVAFARGTGTMNVTIQLQNTGAGHSFPTGSPYKGVRLTAALMGPTKTGPGVGGEAFTADLVRTIEAEPPFRTTTDSRLPAGGVKQYAWAATLPSTALAGDWWLEVSLTRTVSGVVSGTPFSVRRIPLRVD
jgi:hypothetical protein